MFPSQPFGRHLKFLSPETLAVKVNPNFMALFLKTLTRGTPDWWYLKTGRSGRQTSWAIEAVTGDVVNLT